MSSKNILRCCPWEDGDIAMEWAEGGAEGVEVHGREWAEGGAKGVEVRGVFRSFLCSEQLVRDEQAERTHWRAAVLDQAQRWGNGWRRSRKAPS